MKLLVDEDLASRELLSRLETAFPGEVIAPDRNASDEEVWSRAEANHAAILTGNIVDFLALAAQRISHSGLLLVYRQNDPSRDLRAADIVSGVAAVVARYPGGLDDMILVVNDAGTER